MTEPQQKPLAVVTGASSPIGLELAKEFADHDYDVVVAAGDYRIEDAGDEVRAHGADVLTVRADLSTRRGLDRLTAALFAGARPVAAAVLGAGEGRGGSFVETDLADEERLIDLNVTSTVTLAKNLLPAMVGRGTGRVLFTCPGPPAAAPGGQGAVFDASASFIHSFAHALRNELRDTGVTVTSLLAPEPGGAYKGARVPRAPESEGAEPGPELMARRGFEAMMAGHPEAGPEPAATGGR